MKKELKPKNGWRTSLIFACRRSLEDSSTEALPPAAQAAAAIPDEALIGLSLLRRSWYFRSPLSANFAEEPTPPKAKVSKSRSVGLPKRKSRLPALPVRRSTLIDIIKSKRLTLAA